MKLDRLPSGLRVQLSEPEREEMWSRAEQAGIAAVAEETGFSPPAAYGWRSRGQPVPASFVSELLEEAEVTAIKGEGSGAPTVDPRLEFEGISELKTRAELGSSVNTDGVPVYLSGEPELASRFAELLERLGEVPYSLERGNSWRLRYPSHVYRLLSGLDIPLHFPSAFEEEGAISGGKAQAIGEERPPSDLKGELVSRSSRLEVAMELEDGEMLRDLAAGEQARIREAFSR